MKADDRDHSKRFKVSMILKRRIRAISNSIPYPQLSMAPLKGLFLDGSMLRGAKLLISKSFLPNIISFEQDFSQSNSVDRSTAWQNITPIPIRIAPNLVTAGPTNSTHSQRNICFAKIFQGFFRPPTTFLSAALASAIRYVSRSNQTRHHMLGEPW
jgi:hypothetical protein